MPWHEDGNVCESATRIVLLTVEVDWRERFKRTARDVALIRQFRSCAAGAMESKCLGH